MTEEHVRLLECHEHAVYALDASLGKNVR